MSVEERLHHPDPPRYWKIAGLLAILTAIEVSLFYIDEALDLDLFNVFAILALSAIKFLAVVGWFMHLRFEKATLSRFFTVGFVLAVALYLVVLTAMGVVALSR